MIAARLWLAGLAAALLLGAGLARAEGFVWRVSDADSSVYLAGSVHMLPPEAYPLPDAFRHAYQAAGIVAFETDVGKLQSPETQSRLLQAALYQDGSTLQTHLDDAVYSRLEAVVGEMGLPISAVGRFRPWFAAAMIEVHTFMAAGYREQLGVDMHFYDKAKADGKTIVPLETVSEHLALLTDMPADMAQAYLAATLENVDKLDDAPTVVYDYWRRGDADGLARYMREQVTGDPALYERLLFERNRQWLGRIESMLDGNKDAMVVVGALHLVGNRGLLSQLRARGYDVARQ